jgi:hypothetical protein
LRYHDTIINKPVKSTVANSKCLFKGTVSRDFRPLVFSHQTIPLGALNHGLKPFRIWLRICRNIRSEAEFFFKRTPIIPVLIFISNCMYRHETYTRILNICFAEDPLLKGIRDNNRFCKGFRGVIKNSAVSLKPLNPLPRSH